MPANRTGHGTFNAARLKTIQGIQTLLVFYGFSITHLGEAIRRKHLVACGLIALVAYFMFMK